MAVASLALTAIGGAVSAYGQYQSGKAQEAMANHNARIQEQEARTAELEAQENAKRDRANQERQLATMRANLASQGTALDVGSPIAIMGETAQEFELGLQDRYRAETVRARSLNAQAQATRWQGKQASRASKINAFGTLLGTGYKVGRMYKKGVDTGVFKGSWLYRKPIKTQNVDYAK